jgi:hypothetical protein
MHEECADQRVQRRRLLEQELAARGLPCAPHNSVSGFVQGRVKSLEPVFKAMQAVADQRALDAFARSHDSRTNEATREADVLRLAQLHRIPLPGQLPQTPRGPGRLLACLWIRQAKPNDAWELEPKMVQRAAKLLSQSPDELDTDQEARVWLRTARGVVQRFNNSNRS